MPQPEIHEIRTALALASERRSLRRVAAEVGISLGGVHKVVHGASPRPETLRKLIRWYLGQDERPTSVSPEEFRRIAWLLAGELRSETVVDAIEGVLRAALNAVYAGHGLRLTPGDESTWPDPGSTR